MGAFNNRAQKIIDDCVRFVNTLEAPEVLFKRFLLMIKNLVMSFTRKPSYNDAEIQSMLASRDLPELPCRSPKTLKIIGDNLIFIYRKYNVTVPLNSIVSFTLKKPSLISIGHIILQLKQGSNAFIRVRNLGLLGVGSQMIAHYKSQYVELAKVYEKYFIYRNNALQIVLPLSESVPTINDLRELKKLVDEGVLTEEEFCAKKKQILGI